LDRPSLSVRVCWRLILDKTSMFLPSRFTHGARTNQKDGGRSSRPPDKHLKGRYPRQLKHVKRQFQLRLHLHKTEPSPPTDKGLHSHTHLDSSLPFMHAAHFLSTSTFSRSNQLLQVVAFKGSDVALCAAHRNEWATIQLFPSSQAPWTDFRSFPNSPWWSPPPEQG